MSTYLLREAHRIVGQDMIVKTHKEETMPENTNNTEDLKKLRDRSKASMTDCVAALKETNNIEEAIEWLSRKGIIDGLRLQGESKEGAIYAYIHPGAKIGVLLNIGCQTDFVAKTDEFQHLCKDLAHHIAGNDISPKYVSEDTIDPAFLNINKDLMTSKTRCEKGFDGKEMGEIPEKSRQMIEKIVEGRLSKLKKDVCLLSQKFIKDPTLTIEQVIAKVSGLTKEKIIVRAFTRYQI